MPCPYIVTRHVNTQRGIPGAPSGNATLAAPYPTTPNSATIGLHFPRNHVGSRLGVRRLSGASPGGNVSLPPRNGSVPHDWVGL